MRDVLEKPTASLDELFRAWIAAGMQGCPIPCIAALSPESSPEESFSRFVLEEALCRVPDEIGADVKVDFALVIATRTAVPEWDWDKVFDIVERLSALKAEGVPVDMGVLPALAANSPNLDNNQVVSLVRSMADLHENEMPFDVATVVAANELFSDGPAALEALHQRASQFIARTETGPMAEQIRKAAQLEPLINHPARTVERCNVPPSPLLKQIASFRRIATAVDHETAKSVILVNRCTMSGVARVSAALAHALAGIDAQSCARDVVVIRTEESDLDYPEWFPEGCRHVDLPGLNLAPSPKDRRDLLREVLRSLNPDRVFNVNSRLMWDSMSTLHKVLTDQSQLYSYLFCSDINDRGVEAGYPVEFFYRGLAESTGIITDSDYLERTLRERYRVPLDSTKLHSLKSPVLSNPALADFEPAAAGRRPRIYWAGRFDRQKRIELLFEIAARMPDVDFLVWGKPVLDTHLNTLAPPANVQLQGTYASFEDLPLTTCDAWLYTSAWDGVPTLLIDVAAAGIPLVGSLVGGTGEVLADGLSQRLGPEASCDDYIAALHHVINDLPTARSHARTLAEQVTAERSLDSYRTGLRRILNSGAIGNE